MFANMYSMSLGTHVFIVTPETYETHRRYQFCATGKGAPNKRDGKPVKLPFSFEEFKDRATQKDYHGFLADLWNVRLGDVIFFYVTTEGFKGVYRCCSEPFFDTTRVGAVGPERPFRIRIKAMRSFSVAVPEELIFRHIDDQRTFWVWYFAKMRSQGRGCHALDPDARDALIRLLMKRNYGTAGDNQVSDYPNPRPDYIKSIHLEHPDKPGRLATEDTLRAQIIKGIRDRDSNVIPLVGDLQHLEWFANNVPFNVAGRNIDLLLYHREEVFSPDFPIGPRVQYSVIELKNDGAGIKELNQLLGYCSWVAEQLAEGHDYMVQPTLLARRFKRELEPFLVQYRKLHTPFKRISLLRYQLVDGAITLREEDQASLDAPANVDDVVAAPAKRPPLRAVTNSKNASRKTGS